MRLRATRASFVCDGFPWEGALFTGTSDRTTHVSDERAKHLAYYYYIIIIIIIITIFYRVRILDIKICIDRHTHIQRRTRNCERASTHAHTRTHIVPLSPLYHPCNITLRINLQFINRSKPVTVPRKRSYSIIRLASLTGNKHFRNQNKFAYIPNSTVW